MGINVDVAGIWQSMIWPFVMTYSPLFIRNICGWLIESLKDRQPGQSFWAAIQPYEWNQLWLTLVKLGGTAFLISIGLGGVADISLLEANSWVGIGDFLKNYFLEPLIKLWRGLPVNSKK